ncbi:MAG: tetratricopeptide repeat protein [Planctomycetota bacterium]
MNRMTALAVLSLVIVITGCGPKGPTATVDLSYTTQPKTPLDEQHMHIAVRNANMAGDTGEYDQDKWSVMTADLIQYNLQRAAERHNIPLQLVDREHLKLAMEETDLADAGITESDGSVATAAIKAATAIITSKVTIKIDKQKGKGRTVSAGSMFAWARGGGGSVQTTEVEKESRNITVVCQFQLKAAGSNDMLASHSGKPLQDYTRGKTSPFFGGSKTESDMTPRDKVIGDMIEVQLRQFMAKFVPTEIEATVKVKPGKTEMSVSGVRALVIDDYETALDNFKAAVSEMPDDHASYFGAGVACEKLNRLSEALQYYKQAQSLKTKEGKYADAVARVSAFL